jgi:CheY-like chemotaxis protein
MATVLVVDDEHAIASLLENVLEDEGHRVVTASNGRHALQRAAEAPPDLVITDFMMPVMDGAELVRAMAADAHLAKVPVIVMSSMPESAVTQRCGGLPLVFIRKPFNIFDLVDMVARLALPQA